MWNVDVMADADVCMHAIAFANGGSLPLGSTSRGIKLVKYPNKCNASFLPF